jgi:hypothetical protein
MQGLALSATKDMTLARATMLDTNRVMTPVLEVKDMTQVLRTEVMTRDTNRAMMPGIHARIQQVTLPEVGIRSPRCTAEVVHIPPVAVHTAREVATA